MNPTTKAQSIETEVAGMILNALIPAAESCGFQVADRSVNVNGLTLIRPDSPPIRVVFLAVDDPAEDPRWDDTRTEAPEIPPPLTEAEFNAMPYADAPDACWSGRRDDTTLLQPIAGGSLNADHPFEPSPQDWAEYRRMFDHIDKHGDFPGAIPGSGFPVRNRYSPEALANIRRIAWGD